MILKFMVAGQTYCGSSSVTQTVEYDGVESRSEDERKDKHDGHFSHSQRHQHVLVFGVDSTAHKLYNRERKDFILCVGEVTLLLYEEEFECVVYLFE